MKKSMLAITLLLLSPMLFAQVYWVKDFEQAKALAEKQNKLIMVDFWATWCGPCRQMDKDVWSKSEINELSKSFVMAKVDIDFDKSTARKYAVNAIPRMIIMDPFGEQIDERTGYQAMDGVQAFMNGYPADISKIVNQTKSLNSLDDPKASDYIQLGSAFQYYLAEMEDQPRRKFANRSTTHFSKGIKQAEKDGNSTLAQLGSLMKYETMIYMNKGKKVIKQLVDKKEIESMEQGNKAFGHYLLYAAYAMEGDLKNSADQLASYQAIKEQTEGMPESNLGTFLAKNEK